jgi:uncharacterized protein YhbP (UPF0306 family)
MEQVARDLIDGSLYMVVATSDRDGLPWAAPVYYAHDAYREFLWVSRPGTQHSRNIDARPDVSIVIFDSRVPINTGQAVYMSAVAEQLEGERMERAIATFSQRSLEHGADAWTPADVQQPAELRLYVARAREQFVLGEGDERIAVKL